MPCWLRHVDTALVVPETMLIFKEIFVATSVDTKTLLIPKQWCPNTTDVVLAVPQTMLIHALFENLHEFESVF